MVYVQYTDIDAACDVQETYSPKKEFRRTVSQHGVQQTNTSCEVFAFYDDLATLYT